MTRKPQNNDILYLIFFVIGFIVQVAAQPIAKFTFNNGKDYDEVNNKKAKLVDVNYTTDRFGNTNGAVFFSGQEFSYVNLGTHRELKPKTGSISLWISIDGKIWTGR